MARKISSSVSGPLDASYTLTWSDSGCSSSYGTLERLRADLAYFIRQGRASNATPRVVCVESCPVRGCNGNGTRAVKRRSGMFATDVECVGCRGSHEYELDVSTLVPAAAFNGRLVEDMSLNEVLEALGYTTEPAEYGRKVILLGGWPVHRGIADGVWTWLRETGQIL